MQGLSGKFAHPDYESRIEESAVSRERVGRWTPGGNMERSTSVTMGNAEQIS